MKSIQYYLTLVLLVLVASLSAQNTDHHKWYNPATAGFPLVEGQAWLGNTEDFYDRLPAQAKGEVREPVWSLGKNSAGEYLRFTTNAPEIVVRYVVTGGLSMPHMPATGVSGVDLYAKSRSGQWLWASGRYSFKDTIEYRFSNLELQSGLEFRLYLPLYNTVKWLTIGVDEKYNFAFLQKTKEKPVLVYGTSIAQGGCATRPGLGWTNILNRLLNREIINLAFSGNGRLEPAVMNYVTAVDASLFVLDCLPNLVDRNEYPAANLKNRLFEAVNALRSKYPQTPILLADHAISNPGSNLDSSMVNRYAGTNIIFKEAFDEMQRKGIRNIYIITAREMGLNTESTVDGTHPNDIGMMEYAQAYAKKIKQILK